MNTRHIADVCVREAEGTVEDLIDRFWRLAPPERDREFWPVKKVADHLQMHPSRIRQLADEGRIPHVKPFGRIFVHIPTLKQQFKSQQL